jgi:hypothetical protein
MEFLVAWEGMLEENTDNENFPSPFHIRRSFVKIYTSWTPRAWRWSHPNPSKGPIYLPVDKHVSEDRSDVLGHLVGHKSFPAKHRVLYKPARDILQTCSNSVVVGNGGGKVGIFLTVSLYQYVH